MKFKLAAFFLAASTIFSLNAITIVNQTLKKIAVKIFRKAPVDIIEQDAILIKGGDHIDIRDCKHIKLHIGKSFLAFKFKDLRSLTKLIVGEDESGVANIQMY